jgi:hypothetical protein
MPYNSVFHFMDMTGYLGIASVALGVAVTGMTLFISRDGIFQTPGMEVEH